MAWTLMFSGVFTGGSASLDVLSLLKYGLVNAQHVWVMCDNQNDPIWQVG